MATKKELEAIIEQQRATIDTLVKMLAEKPSAGYRYPSFPLPYTPQPREWLLPWASPNTAGHPWEIPMGGTIL